MTSKISFVNLCVENMKRRMWLLVLTILTFFISMPLAMMVALQQAAGYYNVSQEYYLDVFFAFFGIGFHTVLTAGLAIVCAIAGFAWLFSKKKVDLYHSIPVKREKMFAVCYLNGILVYLIPYLTGCLICLVIIGQYLSLTGSMLSMAAMTVGIHILFYLFFYNLMLVAVMLTGNMINCLITGGVLFVYAIALRGLLEVYLATFIGTYYNQGSSFLEEMRFSSPLMALIYFAEHFVKRENSMLRYLLGSSFALYLLQCFVLMALAGVLALLLYRRRPSEAAGRSIAFSKILNLYRILLVIPLSLGSGIFFMALVSGTDMVATAWLIFGLIFGLVLSHGFIEVLFQMDIRAMFSYKKQLLVTGVIVFLVAFSFRYDWYGVNKSIPEKEKLSSMAVYIPDLEEGWVYSEKTDDSFRRYYSGSYIMEAMELTDLDLPYELAVKGRDWFMSQEGRGGGETIYFAVKYNYKNGRELYRQYRLPKEEMLLYMESIYNLPEYKELMAERMGDGALDELTLSDVRYQSITLAPELIPEFVEIYNREYEKLSYAEVKRSGIVAAFDFNQREESGKNVARGRNIPVYGEFEELLQFLKENGVDTSWMIDELEAEWIQEIELYCYEPESYADMSGVDQEMISMGGGFLRTTDRAEIEKLAPYLRVCADGIVSGYYGSYPGLECYVTLEIDGVEQSVRMRMLEDAPLKEIGFVADSYK